MRTHTTSSAPDRRESDDERLADAIERLHRRGPRLICELQAELASLKAQLGASGDETSRAAELVERLRKPPQEEAESVEFSESVDRVHRRILARRRADRRRAVALLRRSQQSDQETPEPAPATDVGSANPDVAIRRDVGSFEASYHRRSDLGAGAWGGL